MNVYLAVVKNCHYYCKPVMGNPWDICSLQDFPVQPMTEISYRKIKNTEFKITVPKYF
jgi:hypothetical protein